MDLVPVSSPNSDRRLWSALRTRVQTILEDRKPNWSSSSTLTGEAEQGRQFRDDSLLLLRGLDSVAASLSQLDDSLSAAQKGLSDLSEPFQLKVSKRDSEAVEDEEVHPKPKRHCSSKELETEHLTSDSDKSEVIDLGKHGESNKKTDSIHKEDNKVLGDVAQSRHMNKAKDVAMSVANKAASLARELKAMKSELSFIQERCNLLEEENRRLRDGYEKGVASEEDDLVRLQLEALLAEKSRLANENASLIRENQCLHQLVEYHQLTSLELSIPYEQAIQGVCLDFSSPSGKSEDNVDDNGLKHIKVQSSSSAQQLELSHEDEYDEQQ